MIEGAKQLPMHHLTVRVPWHDNGWDGTVCKNPCANTSCIVLPHIAENRDDILETEIAGASIQTLDLNKYPPCVDEHGTILAHFPQSRIKSHPYKWATATHGHFADTPFTIQPFSVAAVPFRWMLHDEVEGSLSDYVQVAIDREPQLSDNYGYSGDEQTWLQEGTNQRIVLDTFFGAIVPHESLVFFYAKRTPFADDLRRVIIGVGIVNSVSEPVEYRYNSGVRPPEGKITSYLWERVVKHSIRPSPKMNNGFLLPYNELVDFAERDSNFDLHNCVAFAPDEYFLEFSYGTELLTQDGAISSLLAVQRAIAGLRKHVEAPWDNYLAWIDEHLNRLWKARGGFPGMGAALHAFGIPQANFLAWHLQAQCVDLLNPWEKLDDVMKDPSSLPENFRVGIGDTFREKWRKLPEERRQLLVLLSRFALSNSQAERWFHREIREKEGIEVSDREIIENPYVVFEKDLYTPDPIAVSVVDRGMFPPETVRLKFPCPEPSVVDEAIDVRRVRALMMSTLENEADQGHTLLPSDWIIDRVRNFPMEPACPLDADTIPVIQDKLHPLIHSLELSPNGIAFQLARYKNTSTLIRTLILKRMKGNKNVGEYDWAHLINQALDEDSNKYCLGEREKRARKEKAAALEEIFRSRVSVLVGSAGTGKSTLIKALCQIQSVREGGILLLAPTGKARVRLEEASNQRGGKTIAQFLHRLKRYDGRTGRYYTNSNAITSSAHKTVVIDECSMLTEDQLAAVLDAVKGVVRLILVGDPHQLPPIGAGRPFVDIVNHIKCTFGENVENCFPRVVSNYAELTESMRQQQEGKERLDLLLANAFNANQHQPGFDDVYHSVVSNESDYIRFVKWTQPNQLAGLLQEELVRELGLDSLEDEHGFERSLGGTPTDYKGRTFMFFNRKNQLGDGAAEKAENWQILSPRKQGYTGVLALNRLIQKTFRKSFIDFASYQGSRKKIPDPIGPEGIVYGDKVINVVNSPELRVYPHDREENYVANGDIGIVVGPYKERIKRDIKVEFASQLGYSYVFQPWRFDRQDGNPPLELAYALTVHKTQGSEFETVFLIVPNPCRTLSREMLYTALTRHKRRVVVLHQGDFWQLKGYASVEASEIVRRMTNLFRVATPTVLQNKNNETVYLDSQLVYKTAKGELVRSKSEWIIADQLYHAGIDYQYEQTLNLNGIECLPDFTIIDEDSGITWFWEHNGLLDDEEYKRRWEKKLEAYREAEILPLGERRGGVGTLLVTEERVGSGLRIEDIQNNINHILAGSG